jgi:ribonucleoside-diphosphate reductase alpha chain
MPKRARPKSLPGATFEKDTSCGTVYVTVNFLEGKPWELFSRLGKAGNCTSCQTEALTRALTLALRYGATIPDLVKQLTGLRCHQPHVSEGEEILSCPDAISKVLKDLLDENDELRPADEIIGISAVIKEVTVEKKMLEIRVTGNEVD